MPERSRAQFRISRCKAEGVGTREESEGLETKTDAWTLLSEKEGPES